VREICDRYGVLLVSDEVICAFGRLGYYSGSQRYGYQPDILTFAKGVTSGYAPLGGMLISDAVMEPFTTGAATFLHGVTFAGHPVSAAVAMANLDVFEKEDLLDTGLTDEAAARQLGVSVRTVRRQMAALMGKLGASSRFQAGHKAAERGWLSDAGADV
jgi:adenosylmethionine-8-amino-7-oxononanoate aminotransferase